MNYIKIKEHVTERIRPIRGKLTDIDIAIQMDKYKEYELETLNNQFIVLEKLVQKIYSVYE